MFAAMAFAHYVKPDKGERAEAAAAENIMGGDENKQFWFVRIWNEKKEADIRACDIYLHENITPSSLALEKRQALFL